MQPYHFVWINPRDKKNAWFKFAVCVITDWNYPAPPSSAPTSVILDLFTVKMKLYHLFKRRQPQRRGW